MALAKVVAKLEDVAEANRGLYVADGDKFKLDLDGDEDTGALRVELATAKREAAERRMAIKAMEEKFSGIDPVKTRELLAKFDNDDDKALIEAKDFDKLFAKRSEKQRIEMQRQIDEAHGKAKSAEERVSKYAESVMESKIRSAALKAGVNKYGIEDAVMRILAKREFVLDANDNPVQLDADGNVVLGKDGKTPYSLDEWMAERPTDRPNWFDVTSSGGGAGGSKNNAGGGKTMKRSAFNALPPRDQSAAARQYQIVD